MVLAGKLHTLYVYGSGQPYSWRTLSRQDDCEEPVTVCGGAHLVWQYYVCVGLATTVYTHRL